MSWKCCGLARIATTVQPELVAAFKAGVPSTIYGLGIHLLQQIAKGVLSPLLSWHPLGFVMARVSEPEPDTVLRVHVWHPQLRRPQEPLWPIHDHTYDLTSCVLVGALRNIVYNTYVGAESRIYAVEYQRDRSSLAATSTTANVRSAHAQEVCAGDTYSVRASALHATEVDSGETVVTTLVTRTIGGQARVIGPADGPESLSYDRSHLDRAECDRFRAVLAGLGSCRYPSA